jgi:hypothetical protein
MGLAVALVISVASASSAFGAVPKFVPGSGTMTVASGIGHLETVGGNKVVCSKDTGSGTITSATEGTFKVAFESCESEGFIKAKCTSSGKASGTIATEGKFKLRRETKGGPAVIKFEPIETKFSCSIISVAVKGTLACPVSPTNKKVKTTEHYTVTCAGEKGKAKIKSVENEAETGTEAVKLETSVSGGAFEESDEVTTEEVKDSVESEISA